MLLPSEIKNISELGIWFKTNNPTKIQIPEAHQICKIAELNPDTKNKEVNRQRNMDKPWSAFNGIPIEYIPFG